MTGSQSCEQVLDPNFSMWEPARGWALTQRLTEEEAVALGPWLSPGDLRGVRRPCLWGSSVLTTQASRISFLSVIALFPPPFSFFAWEAIYL
jgi:hypothetical protein